MLCDVAGYRAGLRPPVEYAKVRIMNQMSEEIEPTFLDAFWTVIIQEHRGSDLSLAQWARASGVDSRSLNLLLKRPRAIRCAYAIRLCCGLQLSFVRMLSESIHLKFNTPVGRRCAWRSRLLEDLSAHDTTPAHDAGKLATSICTALARSIADSGRSFSELARESGVGRTVISRLGQAGRQNPSLLSLFDLSCALACQLDVLVSKVSEPLKPAQKKEATHG